MEFLWEGLLSITWQQLLMYVVGGLLIWLAIEKGFEPALLLPMGFGAILVNLPLSGVINQFSEGVGETHGIIQWLFEVGIEASEAFPILLFIGIGAMIDFGPLLANPKLFLCGAAAQAGIFLTILLAAALGFDLKDAASIGIIGAADGPTSILVSQILDSRYVGAIAVAAYSYMALVPIIQPFAIKLVTTKKERAMRMPYRAQAGIFLTILLAAALGFDLKDAASIGIIGAADGPTSILVSQILDSRYVGAIAVAAYSYMALVPIIQPFAIKLVTTKKERAMRMPYRAQGVSKRLRILFPIVVSVIAGLVAPSSVALVGFLMFGNLIRECGVLTSLSQTAQNELANLITLLLGITIAFSMKADQFVQKETIMIMGLGLVAFVLDSMVGVLFVKVLNIFTPKNKINPMVGAAGISAFPMSSRVIEKLGQEADSQNHLLMHAVAANVSGQIASVVAGGVVLQYFANNPIL